MMHLFFSLQLPALVFFVNFIETSLPVIVILVVSFLIYSSYNVTRNNPLLTQKFQ
jgi:hypothetical protein